jgi:hypothetical protein
MARDKRSHYHSYYLQRQRSIVTVSNSISKKIQFKLFTGTRVSLYYILQSVRTVFEIVKDLNIRKI